MKTPIGLNRWHDYSRQPCKYKKKFWRVCPFVVSLQGVSKEFVLIAK